MGWCSVCHGQQAALATGTDETLVEKVNDPTANLTQITVQDLYAPAEYGTNAQPNTLQIRPLLAVRPQLFTPLEQLIQPTFEVVTAPRCKGPSRTTALGDMRLLDLFVMPWPNSEKTRFRWGIGPYFVFPTSTTQFGGQGAWQMGPAAAFSFRQIPRLNIAGLFQQATSFAYTSSRSVPVNSLTSTDTSLSARPRMVSEVERRDRDNKFSSQDFHQDAA